MNPSPDSAADSDLADFLAEAARVRASGMLGRSAQMQRLFEFLVECRSSGRVPKEVEVAIDCFARQSGTDVAQDATVRVAAHKLRKRLEDFYRDAGQAPRLVIPRGEYRLALQAAHPGTAAANTPAVPGTSSWWRIFPATRRERVLACIALLALVLAAGAIGYSWRSGGPSSPQLEATRASALWQPILGDTLPVQLVLGDYYIFGERDEFGRVQRLVREFDINSRRQLEQGFIDEPERAQQFTDLNLAYLPTSSAQALREVLPVVMAAGKPVLLTLASELDPATLKSTHVVYLGYLSGLGMLEDLVLAASRYSVGGSYDELIDSVSGTARTSEAGEPHAPGTRYRDYAYLAAIAGPGGHSHLVIAGTRDVGLMQAAELAADPDRLKELQAGLPEAGPFEALYEVQGLNGINVGSRLLDASPAAAMAAAP